MHGFQDDQMTSNEVTSSTDCHQDGLALSRVPVTPHTATLTGISLPLIAPLSLLPVTSAGKNCSLFCSTDVLALMIFILS